MHECTCECIFKFGSRHQCRIDVKFENGAPNSTQEFQRQWLRAAGMVERVGSRVPDSISLESSMTILCLLLQVQSRKGPLGKPSFLGLGLWGLVPDWHVRKQKQHGAWCVCVCVWRGQKIGGGGRKLYWGLTTSHGKGSLKSPWSSQERKSEPHKATRLLEGRGLQVCFLLQQFSAREALLFFPSLFPPRASSPLWVGRRWAGRECRGVQQLSP